MISLPERAVRCEWWEYLEGMLVITDGHGGLPRLHPGVKIRLTEDEFNDGRCEGYFIRPLPVLDDPATYGCLLTLVRKAWGPLVWIRWWRNIAPDMSGADRGWCDVVDAFGRRLVNPPVQHSTEIEALVAALEAAPKKQGSRW